MTKNAALISPEEVAQRLGKKNPETIRAALRAGTFPIGIAYKAESKWVYAIPRKAFERFMETGRVDSIDLIGCYDEIKGALQEVLAKLNQMEVA